MENKPLFSIATPCYNSAKTIERTIVSVLGQSFRDYEYIIVDGGSTDGTMDIIHKYEPLFEGRMKIKSEPDKGLYDAFNKGIERSVGVYCWNVNSDDYLAPDALATVAKAVEGIKDGPMPIIVGAMRVILEGGKVVRDLVPSASRAARLYKKNGMLNHPAMLVPKSVYDEFGVYDTRFKIAADMDFFHRVYPKYPYFIYIEEVITNMARGGVSNSFVYRKDIADAKLFMKKKYRNPLVRCYYLALWHKAYFLRKRRQMKDAASQ